MSTRINSIPGLTSNISEGEILVLISGADRDSDHFPIWGRSQGYVRGTLRRISPAGNEIVVRWENGVEGVYDLRRISVDKYNAQYDAMRQYGNSRAPSPSVSSSATLMGYTMATDYLRMINPSYLGVDDDENERRKADLKRIEEEKKQAKLAHFDESKLDPLIIAEDVKQEIISILKQSKHAKLIFDEWGLGETIEYGKGMTMLFFGGPGTGKTWAANCISKATNRELLIVNAANIQTSEPGGANRNIEQAFTTATEQNKVLFMDECDSLITTRGDVGMILSSEINTLLTQIEKFEGICILATNRADSLDEALERRIALIVEFPDPNFAARKQIWQTLVPKKMPLGKDVNFDKLAEYALTGGQIKNVVLQAARLAAAAEAKKVELPHIEQAVKRVQKSKGIMGTASRTHQHTNGQDYKLSHG